MERVSVGRQYRRVRWAVVMGSQVFIFRYLIKSQLSSHTPRAHTSALPWSFCYYSLKISSYLFEKKIQVKHACKKFLASAIDMVDEHLSDEYGSRAISSDGHSFEVLNEALSFFHVTLAFQG